MHCSCGGGAATRPIVVINAPNYYFGGEQRGSGGADVNNGLMSALSELEQQYGVRVLSQVMQGQSPPLAPPRTVVPPPPFEQGQRRRMSFTPPFANSLSASLLRPPHMGPERHPTDGVFSMISTPEELHRLFQGLDLLQQGGPQSSWESDHGRQAHLSEEDIAALPTVSVLPSSTDLCPICQTLLIDNTRAINQLPPCGHLFHGECITSWLRRAVSCPVCREPVNTSSSRRGQVRNHQGRVTDEEYTPEPPSP